MGLDGRDKRIRVFAAAKAASAAATARKAELMDLIEEIPNSIDSLLNIVFAKAEYVDSKKSAQGFGYGSLINNKPVNREQHKRTCEELLVRLRRVFAWCEKYQVDAGALVSKGKVIIENQFGKDLCSSKFDPRLPLDILEDMASGKSDANLLRQVMECNVKTQLGGIRVILHPALVALELEALEIDPPSREKPPSIIEIGPIAPQWLRAIFGVEDNRTLRSRLQGKQREETQRKWYVPEKTLQALGDWRQFLTDASKKMDSKERKKVEAFLSLQ
jgi:hypothetical protein